MKEFCLALLNAAKQGYPMHAVHGEERYFCGSFNFHGVLFHYMIAGHKGCFKKMLEQTEKTQWFDVARTGNKFTAIVFEGKKYNVEPVLDL